MFLSFDKEKIVISYDYIRGIYINDRGKVVLDLGENTEYVLESYSLKEVLQILPEEVIDVDSELESFKKTPQVLNELLH